MANVGGGIIPAIFAPDQQMIDQRRALAQALQQQALTTPQGQMISGHYVAPSWASGVERAVQLYSGIKGQQDAAEAQRQNASNQMNMIASLLRGNNYAPQNATNPQPQTSSTNDQLVNQPSPMPNIDSTQSSYGNNFDVGNLVRGSLINQLGGDQASGAYWDQFKTPDSIKAWQAQGINPTTMAPYTIAELRKKGTLELQPGTTTLDLATGQERFQPKVAEGMSVNRDGSISITPGYLPALNSTERTKQAASAGYEPITVNTPSGPVMMTKEQVAQQAGNVPAQPPAQPPANLSATTPNAQLDLKGLNDDQITALAQGIKDPNDRQQFISLVNQARGNQQQQPGIKLQDEGSSRFATEVASKAAQSLLDSRDKAIAATDTLNGIQNARSAIAGGTYQGTGADAKLAVAKFANGVLGINVDPNKVANTDYLKSVLGQGLLSEAKTLGSNPSNADAQRINDIVGSLGKDPNAMNKILDWREDMANRSITRHNNTVQDAEERGMRSPYDLRVQYGQPQNPVIPSQDAIQAELKRRGMQ